MDLLRSRASLQLEVLALRQQLSLVADRDRKRLSFHKSERIFWVWLYRLWPACLQTLKIFKPDTLIRWHRKGFRLYWTWKSRPRRGGRPAIDPDVRKLIRTMSRNNIGWGAPRIHGELKMLGIQISESTVAKYMIRHRNPPSQTWRTFLENHANCLVGIDFFTVPTATFRILYVFIVLSHDRRHIVHFNVTAHPSARYHDQLNRQNRERSWPFLMSVVFIMSTDAQLDFSFGRTAGPIVRRLLPDNATLCPWAEQ
jgi:hypothetical protein